ncbi:MAG: sporulation protein YhbH [Bdellovibrionales bacterium]|nr:sporulation protein YhbH [Bdellovibrionales bacterium]
MGKKGNGGDTIFRPYTQSSHRSDRSARDRLRHRQKVKDSIRDNIGDILAEESIIGRDRNKIVKVPIRSIKEYRFIYGENAPGVAQGNGKQKPGDVVQEGQAGEPTVGQGGGDQPGVDAFETEVTLEELIKLMFDDLELPDLEKKALRQVLSDDARKRKGLRTQGIRPRLNKKETAKNRIKRKLAVRGSRGIDVDKDEQRFPFHKDDMRYFHIVPTTKEVSNAVIFCIMDTSGSMGTVKKYLARSFYFLFYQFVRQKYQNVEVVFIAHHTEAKEVNEQEFFHKVESGGTYISSGYKKALDIIDERYHPSLWNIYAFHCSDGDNFYSDNERAVAAAHELCNVCNLFGYGEIKPSGSAYYSGSMLDIFSQVDRDNFHMIVIEKKEDLWPGFKSFLTKDKGSEQSQKASTASNAAQSKGATP